MGESSKSSAAAAGLLKKREMTDPKHQGKLRETLKLDQCEKPTDNLIAHLYSLKKISDFDILISLFTSLI